MNPPWMEKYKVEKEDVMEGFGAIIREGDTLRIEVNTKTQVCVIYINQEPQGTAFTGIVINPENERLYVDFEAAGDQIALFK